jgi:hypothetical protein
VKHRKTNASIRAIAAGTAVAAAAAAVTVGLVAWPADGESRTAEPVANRLVPAAGGTATIAGKSPAQVRDDVIKKHERRKAAAAARKAREQRQRAARSASRTVSYDGDPRRIASAMMAERYGWGAGQFSCLSSLWERESGWDVHASNSSSGAYGIPQALPGSKMSAYGGDWQNNAVTQIEWGLSYINDSYGTPCGAWSTFQSQGWY